jgi:hypothetical protein
MNLIELSILVVFAVAVGGLSILLPLVISRNVDRGQAFRRAMATRVAELPLAKLLNMHGLDINDYLHGRPIVDVHTQIGQCASCQGAQVCERALTESVNFAPILAYCPNSAALNAASA